MILEVDNLTAGYGDHVVLRDVTLGVDAGEVVAVLGANGAGKSTLLRTLAGLQPARAGTVRFAGDDLDGMPAYRRARCGLVLAPEGQQSFPDMTVGENLRLAARVAAGRGGRDEVGSHVDEVLDFFPKLGQRLRQSAGTLSGGERQMLSISRALLTRPRVLMLDEPSHGLAPIIVDQLAETIRLLSQRTAILLVEQNLSVPRHCATRTMVLDHSRIAASGGKELLDDAAVVSAYLGM